MREKDVVSFAAVYKAQIPRSDYLVVPCSAICKNVLTFRDQKIVAKITCQIDRAICADIGLRHDRIIRFTAFDGVLTVTVVIVGLFLAKSE